MNELAVEATVSAGISQAHPNSTLDSLIKAADDALYQAKNQGRDRVEIAKREERKPPAETAEAAPSVALTRKVA
jgi:predicted signal transduction protein with EAL and GGDEF domain